MIATGHQGGAVNEGDRPTRRPRVGWTGARFPRAVADQEPGGPEVVEEPRPVDDEPGEVGRTGARFNSRARRARRSRREVEELSAAEAELAPPFPRAAAPEPEPDDAPTMPLFLDRVPLPESTRTIVRPYVRTRGRTRARTELRVETLVSIPSPRPPLDDPEHRAIGEVCGDPRSVAEVAALLSVPLGVARVLIDDMAGEGKLTVHPALAPTTSSGHPRPEVLRRVLDGLRRL